MSIVPGSGTATAVSAVSSGGRRRKMSPARLDSAIACRMPKKMKRSGVAKKVATVIAAAAATIVANRLRKGRQRISG